MRKLKAIEMHRMSIEQFKEAEKLPHLGWKVIWVPSVC